MRMRTWTTTLSPNQQRSLHKKFKALAIKKKNENERTMQNDFGDSHIHTHIHAT